MLSLNRLPCEMFGFHSSVCMLLLAALESSRSPVGICVDFLGLRMLNVDTYFVARALLSTDWALLFRRVYCQSSSDKPLLLGYSSWKEFPHTAT